MVNLYCGYKSLEDFDDKTVFFAGANTDSGFVSSYPSIADEKFLDRIYVIKGGAGCGKSSLMRYIADRCEKRGHKSEYFLCGSDPLSIDLVRLDGRIAILDGTAPHVRDMTYAGVSSEIIDVSRYLRIAELEGERDEIIRLCDEKSNAYKSTYRFLNAAAISAREMLSKAEKIYLSEKANAFILRTISNFPKAKNKTGRAQEIFTHAITMRGRYRVSTFKKMAAKYFNVEDFYSLAPIFMKNLAESLVKFGYDIVIGKMPICGLISSIFIKDIGVAFEVGREENGNSNINLARFASRESVKNVRGSVRLCGEIYSSCINAAEGELERAAEAHFNVEKKYISDMDFAALEKYRGELMKDISERLRIYR